MTAIGVAKGAGPRRRPRALLHQRASDRFTLPARDPVLYFVQRLRDEAHRFAIGSHRAGARRKWSRTRSTRSPASAPRKRALLLHFGTAKAVSRAAVEDLMKVDGISEAVAVTSRNHFRT